MPTEIKICGLKTANTLAVALEAGADYVGLVFFAPSPRHVADFALARDLGQVRGLLLGSARGASLVSAAEGRTLTMAVSRARLKTKSTVLPWLTVRP